MSSIYNWCDRWHVKWIIKKLIVSVQNFWYAPCIYIYSIPHNCSLHTPHNYSSHTACIYIYSIPHNYSLHTPHNYSSHTACIYIYSIPHNYSLHTPHNYSSHTACIYIYSIPHNYSLHTPHNYSREKINGIIKVLKFLSRIVEWTNSRRVRFTWHYIYNFARLAHLSQWESRGTSQKNNFFWKVLNYISNSMEQ